MKNHPVFISGKHQAVTDLVSALGLPADKLVSFSMHFDVGEAVEIRARCLAEEGQVDAMTPIVRRYRLAAVEVPEHAPSHPLSQPPAASPADADRPDARQGRA